MWGYKADCKATKTAKNCKIDKNETVIYNKLDKNYTSHFIFKCIINSLINILMTVSTTFTIVISVVPQVVCLAGLCNIIIKITTF